MNAETAEKGLRGLRRRALPSLLAVLAFVVSLAGLCVIPAPALAAPSGGEDGEVGIEAQGVRPWFVLRNRWNLDLRDNLNRPVSPAKLERELKAVSASVSAENAYASRLPFASVVIKALELLPAVQARLRELLPQGRVGAAAAAWLSRPPRLLVLLVLVASLSIVRARPGEASSSPAGAPRLIPSVLRC